jgi:hypothetical protein
MAARAESRKLQNRTSSQKNDGHEKDVQRFTDK